MLDLLHRSCASASQCLLESIARSQARKAARPSGRLRSTACSTAKAVPTPLSTRRDTEPAPLRAAAAGDLKGNSPRRTVASEAEFRTSLTHRQGGSGGHRASANRQCDTRGRHQASSDYPTMRCRCLLFPFLGRQVVRRSMKIQETILLGGGFVAPRLSPTGS